MRRLFTTQEAIAAGLTKAALAWGEQAGRWRRITRGVYGDGAEEPCELDRLLARVIATKGVASGHLAGVLHGLDAVDLDARPIRRRPLPPERVVTVGGVPCTDGLQTLVDLAATLDDARWEQALESGLRKRLLTIPNLERTLPDLGRGRTPGTTRIRRVLDLRPAGAPPTESLLETLMVQLVRTVPGLREPLRQSPVVRGGRLIARLDLSWPPIGLFIELDGEHHKGQPVYDARRETAVVACTGWLCGRFTWTEVVRVPVSTAPHLAALVEQARRRPVA